jgi:hypothetical protein
MSMAHSQFIRIVTLAGGERCSDRRFIRSCHTLLKHEAKGRGCRVTRHEWLRGGLRLLWDTQQLTACMRIADSTTHPSCHSLTDYEDQITEVLRTSLCIVRTDALAFIMLYSDAVVAGFEQGISVPRMASLIAAQSELVTM